LSRTRKIILIVLGVIVLCCCASSFSILYPYVKDFHYIMNPEEVVVQAREIMDFQLPPDYEGYMCIQYINIRNLSLIKPGDDANHNPVASINITETLLKEGEKGPPTSLFTPEVMKNSIENSGNLQFVEEHTTIIRGSEVTISTYETIVNGNKVYMVFLSTFIGKQGAVDIKISGQADYWDQEEIDAFINSIQ
jgi:hypothetical protein